MGSKILHWTDSSDAYSEDVLKCIKETLKKEVQSKAQYRPIKTAARNYVTHKTLDENVCNERTQNHERRKGNLSLGFFSEKTKPYQPLGTVLLDAGDLMLESITEDVRSKIKKLPRRYTKNKVRSQERSQLHSRNAGYSPAFCVRHLPKKNGVGYGAIKDSIDELKDMQQKIQGQSGYLLNYLAELPDRIKMNSYEASQKKRSKTKSKQVSHEKNYPIMEIQPLSSKHAVVRTESIVSSEKESEIVENASQSIDRQSVDSEKSTEFKTDVTVSSPVGFKQSTLTRREEMKEFERREQELREFRKKNRAEYTKLKLQAINSLFCALYNMRMKSTKLPNLLNQKFAKELLGSDVIINNFGRPVPWRHQPHQFSSSLDERSSVAEESTNSSMDTPSDSKLHVGLGNSSAKKQTGSPTNLTNTPFKGTKEIRVSTAKSTTPSKEFGGEGQKHLRRRRDTLSQIIGDSPTPWLHVNQTEKKILDRARASYAGNFSKRTAEDVLGDIKRRFIKSQAILQLETEEECERLRNERAKVMKCKFFAITVAPIAKTAFCRMRAAAKFKVLRERNDNLAQPLKWYVDLRDNVSKEPNSIIYVELLEKIARFQYESDKSIPFAKEKLCLLIMSTPAHILLTAHMVDALYFFIKRVLNTTSELLQIWLSYRKLDKISILLKKQFKRRIIE